MAEFPDTPKQVMLNSYNKQFQNTFIIYSFFVLNGVLSRTTYIFTTQCMGKSLHASRTSPESTFGHFIHESLQRSCSSLGSSRQKKFHRSFCVVLKKAEKVGYVVISLFRPRRHFIDARSLQPLYSAASVLPMATDTS